MISTAKVKIWDMDVAAVAWDDEYGLASFEWEPSFKRHRIELAPLKMSLDAPIKIHSFPELRKERNSELDTFKGLPGLLSDSLPDRYGNQLINIWLAQNGRPSDSLNPVELLCFIGSRGMGALEFEPVTLKENRNTYSIEIEQLVDIASRLLNEKKHFKGTLSKEDQNAIHDILRIGTSAGGARPKAVIAFNEKTGEIRSGQTKAPQGFNHWLLKFDGVSDVQLGASRGYGNVEMAYHLMAKDCGIEMTECRLLEENGRAHFMTRRFDREDGYTKHHVQTFCSMKHYDYNNVNSFSYEQLFQCMRELRLSYPEGIQMFRRMVFNVLSRNCDDHTKNFSFILRQNDRWRLAPAYDLCHAYKPEHKWVSRHALSINGKRDEISKKDMLMLAENANIEGAGKIIDEINDVVSDWTKYAKSVDVSKQLMNSIDDTLIHL